MLLVTGSVTSINVTSGGSGYTTEPIVSITGGGATADNQASAIAQITDGVTGINIVSGGSGYTSVPTVTILVVVVLVQLQPQLVGGPVDAINITDAGTQYTYEPTINLISGSGAVAYPSILMERLKVSLLHLVVVDISVLLTLLSLETELVLLHLLKLTFLLILLLVFVSSKGVRVYCRCYKS